MTQLQEKQEQRVLAIADARKRAQGKANVFAEVFGNPQGAEVLEELKEQFDLESLYGGNEFDTVYKAAQRDVVRWIQEVITRGQKNAVEG